MAVKYIKNIILNDVTIPMEIHLERRNGVRVSIGKKNIFLRLPHYFTPDQNRHYVQWAEQWFIQRVNKKPHLLNRFTPNSYLSGDTVRTQRKTYTLQISHVNRKTASARLLAPKHIVQFHLPYQSQGAEIPVLLSRVIAQDQFMEVFNRLNQLNDQFFKQPFGTLKLKYNTTNWGSCSHKRNINISTRLLFAPIEVQDYVLVHELAHLIEPNHSQQFWNLVRKVMPDYKQKERWLSENSHLCNF